MPDAEKDALFKVGDKVRLKGGPPLVGTVTEVRGTNPRAAHILYRVRVPMDPEPLWLEVREDEVEKA